VAGSDWTRGAPVGGGDAPTVSELEAALAAAAKELDAAWREHHQLQLGRWGPTAPSEEEELEFDANRLRCEEAQARLDELERRLDTVVATQGPPRPPRARERGVHYRKAPGTTVDGVMAGWQRLGAASTASAAARRASSIAWPSADPGSPVNAGKTLWGLASDAPWQPDPWAG
jgi:hypothetical protein